MGGTWQWLGYVSLTDGNSQAVSGCTSFLDSLRGSQHENLFTGSDSLGTLSMVDSGLIITSQFSALSQRSRWTYSTLILKDN